MVAAIAAWMAEVKAFAIIAMRLKYRLDHLVVQCRLVCSATRQIGEDIP